MSTSSSASTAPSASAGPALRHFAGYALLRLAGKSLATMAWQVSDPRDGRDLLLLLPRSAPQGQDLVETWVQRARKAARLDHPNLARVLHVGVHEGWPYVLHELQDDASLADRIGSRGLLPVEAASVSSQMLHALAYAHDAGVTHRDLQGFSVLVSDKGHVRLLGLEVSCVDPHAGSDPEAAPLRAQRVAAETDVLHVGVLLHHMLTGQPVLDEPDPGKVLERLPPQGREIVRLGFSTPRPIPEPLRVIANRAIDRQERQRYRSARTLARALDGWLQVEEANQGGPLALMLDRMRAVGVLPASPGVAERAARLARMERGRTDELAEVLLEDVALSFELLRTVNSAHVRGGQVSGNGAVLTVRRSIAMIGMDGVRRVAMALRTWPGPLNAAHADDLQGVMDRARRAGRVAMSIRPAGYDGEVVYLVTLLQNLGRLVVQYHFPDEAGQIRRLMLPAVSDDGGAEEPGMGEEAASMAVLGVELEAIGTAVARWWGMDDSVLHMMRRLPLTSAVRVADSDDDHIRMAASCANEAVDALGLPARRMLPGLQAVVHRYGRALGLSLRDLQAALSLVPPSDAGPQAAGARASAAAAEHRVGA